MPKIERVAEFGTKVIVTANNVPKMDYHVQLLRGAAELGWRVRYNLAGDDPETQTAHTQAYTEFYGRQGKKGLTLADLKKIDPGWHWEFRRGTQDQAITYIKGPGPITCHDGHVKTAFDPDPIVYGSPDPDDKDEDFNFAQAVINMIRAGKFPQHVHDAFPIYGYHNSRKIEEAYKNHAKPPPPLESPCHVIFVYGASRTGKEYFLEHGFLADKQLGVDFFVPGVSPGDQRALWFDKYKGEEILYLPNYIGEMPLVMFCRLFDNNAVLVPTKGSFVYARPKVIIITSNNPPKKWYPSPTWSDRKERLERICRGDVYIPDPTTPPEVRSRMMKLENAESWFTGHYDDKEAPGYPLHSAYDK